jgi:hypothetical protein
MQNMLFFVLKWPSPPERPSTSSNAEIFSSSFFISTGSYFDFPLFQICITVKSSVVNRDPDPKNQQISENLEYFQLAQFLVKRKSFTILKSLAANPTTIYRTLGYSKHFQVLTKACVRVGSASRTGQVPASK